MRQAIWKRAPAHPRRLDDEKAPRRQDFLTTVETGHFRGTVFHRVIKLHGQGGGFDPA